jgi:pilus assembly protein Flp/PilA
MLFPQSSDRGQGLLEYSLVIALIAIIVVVILALLGPAVGNMFSNVVNYI